MPATDDLQPSPRSGTGTSRLRWGKVVLAFAAVVGLVIAYQLFPIADWVEAFQTWVRGLGPAGWVIFILVYALTCFALVPGSILTLAAGVAYGLWGFPLVIAGATLGSALSFLAARYIFRDKVQARIADYPMFDAINQAIGEEDWKVVVLLRLSPALPFSLQNWFLGLTPSGFWPAQIATFFGIMPGTLLYVWIGSLGGETATGGGGMSVAKYAIFGLGLVATLVVSVLIARKAKAKLAAIQARAG